MNLLIYLTQPLTMSSFDRYCVDRVIEPVQILEIGQDATSLPATSSYERSDFSTTEELEEHFQNTPNKPYKCRLM